MVCKTQMKCKVLEGERERERGGGLVWYIEKEKRRMLKEEGCPFN